MLAALLALLCPACGLLLILSLWPGEWKVHWPLQSSLSFGFGLGVFSIVFVVLRSAGRQGLLAIDLAVFALLLAGYLYKTKRNYTAVLTSPLLIEDTESPWLLLVLRAAFAVALLAALYSAILRTIAHPHGDGWDAFAIWNLHARFLFRGGEHWRDGFTTLIPWSHPDYPLLLPSIISHFWTALGRESQLVPALIGLLFTFSTVGLLFASLARLRGQISATLAGLTLLATPFFIEQGTAQYADVPLSFFILATIVLTCLCENSTGIGRHRGLLVLAGISCGFGAWTKNEGLLFLLALLAAWLLTFVITPSASIASNVPSPGDENAQPAAISLVFILTGVAPFLLLIAWFKHLIGAPNELFSSIALHKLLDATRYLAILKWYGKDFLRFGDWFLIPGTLLLAGIYFASPNKHVQATSPGPRACRIALAMTLAGYFVIYLITPYDLYWHLRFSLNRLFLQLWPAVVFLFFLHTPTFDPSDLSRKSVSR